MRSRYGDLLGSKYNLSETYTRSTDSTRTKMTILAAMAAAFLTYGRGWSSTLDWTPVPYTTVPAKYDYNLATLNCPNFKSFYNSIMIEANSGMDKYSDLFDKLTNFGYSFSSMPLIIYALNDLFVSQTSLGLPLSEEMAVLMPNITEAAGTATDILFGNETYLPLQAGPLLYEFFENAELVMAGKYTDTDRYKSLRIYSAHDINVFSFKSILQVYPRQGVPEYASMISVELRRVTETGEYVVLPVYLKSPEDDPVHLKVKDCDVLCSYVTFKKTTYQYSLNETKWRSDCGFDPSVELNLSSIR